MPLDKSTVKVLVEEIKRLETVLTCPVCEEVIKRDSAVTLNCPHHVCSQCADELSHDRGKCIKCSISFAPRDIKDNVCINAIVSRFYRLQDCVERAKAIVGLKDVNDENDKEKEKEMEMEMGNEKEQEKRKLERKSKSKSKSKKNESESESESEKSDFDVHNDSSNDRSNDGNDENDNNGNYNTRTNDKDVTSKSKSKEKAKAQSKSPLKTRTKTTRVNTKSKTKPNSKSKSKSKSKSNSINENENETKKCNENENENERKAKKKGDYFIPSIVCLTGFDDKFADDLMGKGLSLGLNITKTWNNKTEIAVSKTMDDQLRPKMTYKFLGAILNDIPIVHYKYITNSYNKGYIVDYKSYLCNYRRVDKNCQMFNGYTFLFGRTQTQLSKLKIIIQAGGGYVCQSEQDRMKSDPSLKWSRLLIARNDTTKSMGIFLSKKYNCRCIQENWILNSIYRLDTDCDWETDLPPIDKAMPLDKYDISLGVTEESSEESSSDDDDDDDDDDNDQEEEDDDDGEQEEQDSDDDD